ncbi:MAG: GNAT family N-acetyltransferase [Haloferacaceae archaeon]
MPRIVDASTDHAPDVCRVCERGWRDAYEDLLPAAYVEANVSTWYRPERVREEIADPAEWDPWRVALDGDRVVGAARGGLRDGGEAEVFNLYVDPDAQGAGVGSELLAGLTERHRARGATAQVVESFAGNESGLGFYRSKGFAEVDRHPAAAVAGVDPDHEAVRLRRDL